MSSIGKIDEYGTFLLDEEDLLKLFYQKKLSSSREELIDLHDIVATNDDRIKEFNEKIKPYDALPIKIYDKPTISIEENDNKYRNDWFISEEYNNINIKEFLLEKCKTDEEKNRILEELKLFEERNMTNVLRFLIYFVDYLRSNNLVWGVGRGSSCASYALYLIGIHKVNAIKYNLDIKEFLK